MSVYLSAYKSCCRSIDLSVGQSIYLSVCLCVLVRVVVHHFRLIRNAYQNFESHAPKIGCIHTYIYTRTPIYTHIHKHIHILRDIGRQNCNRTGRANSSHFRNLLPRACKTIKALNRLKRTILLIASSDHVHLARSLLYPAVVTCC